VFLSTWGLGLAYSNFAPGVYILVRDPIWQMSSRLIDVDLYRLLRGSVHVPVGLTVRGAIALRCVDLVKGSESSCDRSNAAHKQDWDTN
jgi:hypothetical protein